MGKKRKLLPTGSDRLKIDSKEEKTVSSSGSEDVLNARDRLKGALQDLLVQSDDSSISSNDESMQSEVVVRPSPVKKPVESVVPATPNTRTIRQQRKRRRREAVSEGAFHHTYVMKLFDRSVDLAQFKEDTPLYPVCRAWMANQPRNTNLVPKMRTPTPEPPPDDPSVDGTGNGEESETEIIRDIYKMPLPIPPPNNRKGRLSMRIPSPVPQEQEELILDYDIQPPIPREILLQKHLTHWNNVRRKWYNASRLNEERYAESGRILKAMFKKAQKAFA